MPHRSHFRRAPWVALVALLAGPPFGGRAHGAGGAAALPRSAPEAEGVSSPALLEFIEATDRDIDAMHSFILVRHGKVVAEGWWKPYDPETPHILFSLSKSFTSTAVGLAVAEGKLSLDDEVLKAFPDEAPADPSANLRAMRVRDLLRMSAGHQTEASLWRDEPGSNARDVPWTKKFLAHPVPFKPGTHFVYNSPATYMLSAMVQKATGSTVLDYLRPRLFDPLGFKDPVWIASPQGVTVGAFGLLARTEEIARFGQLYLQRGAWKGQQLIPAEWVNEATRLQTSNGGNPASDWDQGYGYQFWRSRHNSYRGDGAFGQFCLVFPELDAVVAITSGVRDMQSVLNVVWDKLLPAIHAEAVPEDAGGRQKLEAKLASLTVRFPVGQPAPPLAAQVSGRTYRFSENDRGIEAMSLELTGSQPTLRVRAAGGETRTPIGREAWVKTPEGFTNGLDRALGVPKRPTVAASGAWTSTDVYTVKLILCETPFSSTLAFRFEGDRVSFDAEHNVAFGPTKLPQLIGQADTAK